MEVPKAAAGFREFLKTLKKPAAQDVNDKCKVLVSNSSFHKFSFYFLLSVLWV